MAAAVCCCAAQFYSDSDDGEDRESSDAGDDDELAALAMTSSLTKDLAVAASALALSSALGFGLEALAARRYFGLHLVPLGPGAGADVALDEPVPKPYGEHGWVPLPLGLLDVALVLAGRGAVMTISSNMAEFVHFHALGGAFVLADADSNRVLNATDVSARKLGGRMKRGGARR